jgi:hypothetical protein
MSKFKPAVLLDEQMYLSGDTQNTLLYQIREEAKETNRLLRKLVELNEPVDTQDAVSPETEAPADPEAFVPPESPDATPEKKTNKKK